MARDNPQRPTARKEPVPGRSRQQQSERSVGELFRDLAEETQALIKQEFRLVRVEAKEKATQASHGVGWMAAGGLVAYGGFLALVGAVALMLGTFLPLWVGFLLAGAIVVATGYAIFQKGLTQFNETDFSFNRTAESLGEDKSWIKHEAEEVKQDPAHLGSDHRQRTR